MGYPLPLFSRSLQLGPSDSFRHFFSIIWYYQNDPFQSSLTGFHHLDGVKRVQLYLKSAVTMQSHGDTVKGGQIFNTRLQSRHCYSFAIGERNDLIRISSSLFPPRQGFILSSAAMQGESSLCAEQRLEMFPFLNDSSQDPSERRTDGPTSWEILARVANEELSLAFP